MARSQSSFQADERGAVAVFFGLMAMGLFMFIGAAVDMSRWHSARSETLSALDAAVLAAGRALQTNGGDTAKAIAVGQTYFNAAVAGIDYIQNKTAAIEVVDNGTAVVGSTTASVRTFFMRLAGVNELPLLTQAKQANNPSAYTNGAEFAKAVLSIGANARQNLEVAMMLDVSGSMNGTTSSGNTKIVDMKTAAKDFIDILVWDDQNSQTSKVALIPFSTEVKPPATLLTAVLGTVTSLLPTFRYFKFWYSTSCAAERPGANKFTDAVPSLLTNLLLRHRSQDGKCDVSAEVMPLSNDKNTLTTRIDSLSANGATAGHVGTAWAYYMLSPNWGGLLSTGSKPAAYNAGTRKIAVLLTDGEYNSVHDDKGIPTEDSSSSGFSFFSPSGSVNSATSSVQAKSICTAMKANNIEVYTIAFDLEGNVTANDTLSNCATDAKHYYKAKDGEQLQQAFRDIAIKSTSLYLTN